MYEFLRETRMYFMAELNNEIVCSLCREQWHILVHLITTFKAAVLHLLKKEKNEKQITVNTSQIMFSGEIFYTKTLIQLTKSLVKHSFTLHNLLRY